MRLTLDEYSKKFKMSKEMIHSRLKSKKLNYVIEDGVTYIVAEDVKSNQLLQQEDNHQEIQNVVTTIDSKPRTTVALLLALYQRENAKLKEKINFLEEKVEQLIDDKETILREQQDKIEEIYNRKDAQLQTILELVNTKLLLEQKTLTHHEKPTIPPYREHPHESSELVELKEYLNRLDLKSSQKKLIKKRFDAVYQNDIRIINQNGKIYLDFSKYDYSDLFSY